MVLARLRTQIQRLPVIGLLLAGVISGSVGCGTSETTALPPADAMAAPQSQVTASAPGQNEIRLSPAERGQDAAADAPSATAEDFEFAPLNLTPAASRERTAGAESDDAAGMQLEASMEHLNPLQILLGQWRGTTRREYDGFKAVDSHEWLWDLQTDPQQPALVLHSDKSPYLQNARLTWDDAAAQFQLTADDGSGNSRILRGGFAEPVRETVGSDDKLHRVFRLEFEQISSPAEDSSGESWKLAFDQQDNNRYLLEVWKRRGRADFRQIDTVSTQREGTSFAASDSGYAEKTCVISEGLGTIELTYKGRSYWVCCTGCKAAFEEDPEKWIARAAKRAADRK